MSLFLVTFAVAYLAFGFATKNDDDAKEIKWHGFAEALKKGKAENKMIVVDFYTDWCSWCKVMDKKTYGNSEVIEFATRKLVMSKVNAESNEKTTYKGKEYTYRQLTAGFGITGYPATIFLSPEGEYITDISGYITADKFLPMLEFLEGKHYETMKYEEFVAKKKAR
jgi:thioredoxin-related protein